MQEESLRAQNPRTKYLREAGLSTDPFITPVAELELGLAQDIPTFYSFYSPPNLMTLSEQSIRLQDLRQPQHSFVYGEPGSGKTTLRFALEAECRAVLADDLVVTYTLGEDVQAPLSAEDHGNRLARAVAIDLFIQVVERFDPRTYPNAQQVEALKRQIAIGGVHLYRLIRTLIDSPRPKARAGLGTYWSFLGRSPVRYIPSSQSLLDLLNDCLHDLVPVAPVLQGWESVWQALAAARLWGFERALVLIDGVDTRDRDEQAMSELIRPLLAQLKIIQDRNLFFKFFLPPELQNLIAVFMQTISPPLKFPALEAKIIWVGESLQQLLVQRFRSAGSYFTGFVDLTEKDFSSKVDDLIIEKAAGSPRRMLQLASALIDAHIAHSPTEDRIREADWAAMLETMNRFNHHGRAE